MTRIMTVGIRLLNTKVLREFVRLILDWRRCQPPHLGNRAGFTAGGLIAKGSAT